MTHRLSPPCYALALLLLAARAHAQLTVAYDDGYKPLVGLNDKLSDLINSAEKREDYAAVKDLGAAITDKLDKIVRGLENAGKSFKDADNQTWIRNACAPSIAAAKDAKAKAEKLRDKGDAKQNCKEEAVALNAALRETSDKLKACWKDHEDYRKKVTDTCLDAMEKLRSSETDAGRAAADARKKVDELARTAEELHAKAAEKSREYKQADALREAALTELLKADFKMAPADYAKLKDIFTAALEKEQKARPEAAEAEKKANEASRALAEARESSSRINEEFEKHELVVSQGFFALLVLRQRAFEFCDEYRPFSW